MGPSPPRPELDEQHRAQADQQRRRGSAGRRTCGSRSRPAPAAARTARGTRARPGGSRRRAPRRAALAAVAERARDRATARRAHASAAATCSGVSHPAPNARVICGANTCESPSTVPGSPVGDDLAAGEHHDARGDGRGQLHVVRGDSTTAAAVRGVPPEEPHEPVLRLRGRGRASARPAAAPARRPPRPPPWPPAAAARRRGRAGGSAASGVDARARRASRRPSTRPARARAAWCAPRRATVSANRMASGSCGTERRVQPGPRWRVAVDRDRAAGRRRARPRSLRSSVVLPAPLRPITATISPAPHREVHARAARGRRRATR